jgi:hypothetical protein
VDLGVGRSGQQRRPQLPQGRHLRDRGALNDTVVQTFKGAHRSCDEGTDYSRTDDGHADVRAPASTDAEADAGAAGTDADTDVRPASHAHVAGAVAPTDAVHAVAGAQLRAISKAHYVNM